MADKRDRATQIERAADTQAYNEQEAREHIDAALSQLRGMLAGMDREAQRQENSPQQVLDHIRHQLAWSCANVSTTLNNADRALREALVAKAKLDILRTVQE